MLQQWVSLALKKALSKNNIRKGFLVTRIYSIGKYVIDKFITLATTLYRECNAKENNNSNLTNGVGALVVVGRILIPKERGFNFGRRDNIMEERKGGSNMQGRQHCKRKRKRFVVEDYDLTSRDKVFEDSLV